MKLALVLALIATPALAEVCDKARPDWDGTPATLTSEAVMLFMSPIGLFLLGALAVAVVFRHAMGTALVALMWSFYITMLIWPDTSGIRDGMLSEGCAAPPTLFIAASALLCLAAVIYAHRGEKRL